MFKRFFTAIIVIVVLFLAWYFQSIQPVTRMDVPTVDYEIKTGSSVDQIANELSQAHLIRSRIAFKITVIRLGLASRIQAGYFKLSPSMSTTDLTVALTHAYARQIRVTVQEGLRKEEINFILEKAFSQVKGNQYNPTEFTRLTKNLEGHLFPDTYDFSPEASASDVIKKMTGRFDEIVTELNISQDELPRTLILASLLEREAANAEEMPLIAGVIEKRLSAGWPLQIDATIQYAVASDRCHQLDCDWWKNSLTKADLALKSPYNTYINPGLPPSPISNPGKTALAAATNPVKNSAWFYLHDLQGKIHFADTIEQHNQNICIYLKKDCP